MGAVVRFLLISYFCAFCETDDRAGVASKTETQKVFDQKRFSNRYLEALVLQEDCLGTQSLSAASRFTSDKSSGTRPEEKSPFNGRTMDLPFLPSSAQYSGDALLAMQETLEASSPNAVTVQESSNFKEKDKAKWRSGSSKFEKWGARNGSPSQGRSRGRIVWQQPSVGEFFTSIETSCNFCNDELGRGKRQHIASATGTEAATSSGRARSRPASPLESLETGHESLASRIGNPASNPRRKSEGPGFDTWTHQSVRQIAEATICDRPAHLRHGPDLENFHSTSYPEVRGAQRDVPEKPCRPSAGLYEKEPGIARSKGGGAAGIKVIDGSSTIGDAVATARRSRCLGAHRTISVGRCLHGSARGRHGGSRGGRSKACSFEGPGIDSLPTKKFDRSISYQGQQPASSQAQGQRQGQEQDKCLILAGKMPWDQNTSIWSTEASVHLGAESDDGVTVKTRPSSKSVRFDNRIEIIEYDDLDSSVFTLRMVDQDRHGPLRPDMQALMQHVPDANSFKVQVWCIRRNGMGSSFQKSVQLHRGQENQWFHQIASKYPEEYFDESATVHLVLPQPRVRSIECSSHAEGVPVVHVIISQTYHYSNPILLDMCVDGQCTLRATWLVNVRKVEDIFRQTTWGGYVDGAAWRCWFDDNGISLSTDVQIAMYNGYYGTMHLHRFDASRSKETDGRDGIEEETSAYATGDFDHWAPDIDASALFQIPNQFAIDMHKVVFHHNWPWCAAQQVITVCSKDGTPCPRERWGVDSCAMDGGSPFVDLFQAGAQYARPGHEDRAQNIDANADASDAADDDEIGDSVELRHQQDGSHRDEVVHLHTFVSESASTVGGTHSNATTEGGKRKAPCLSDRWCADLSTSSSGNTDGNLLHQKIQTQKPVVLSLEAVIETTPRDTSPEAIILEKTTPAIFRFDCHSWSEVIHQDFKMQLGPLPDGLVVKDATLIHMLRPCIDVNDSPTAYEIYVDGSAWQDGAGWSVVVVQVFASGNTRFHSCGAGLVEVDVNSKNWIGADETDNVAAELTAFVVAQWVALTKCNDLPTTIRPDLKLSAKIAEGSWTCTSHPKLMQLCAAGVALANGVHPAIREIRGHTNNPWNELADSLANSVRNLVVPSDLHDFQPLHDLVVSEDLAWVWVQNGSDSLKAAFPQCIENQLWQITPSQRRIHIAHSDDERLQPTKIGTFSCKVVTANVLALDSRSMTQEVGRAAGPRTSRLDDQWHQAGCQIIGIQEARTEEGCYQSDHYRIFSSGCHTDQGIPRFGCELWLHKFAPIGIDADRRAITIDQLRIAVIHADSRRLFVSATGCGLQFLFVVLHAPCLNVFARNESREFSATFDKWWHDTSTIMSKHAGFHKTIVMIDANAPLATHVTQLFSDWGIEPSNRQGETFEEFLQVHQLAVPCTFENLHKGQCGTWMHPATKKWYRRDYVLVSSDLLPCVSYSQVQRDHDTAFAHEDHIPAEIHIEGGLHWNATSPRPKLCEKKLRDPKSCAAFREALASLPIPTWDVNVDDHARLQDAQIWQLAQQHFGRDKGKTKQRPKITETTQNLIQWKRQVLDFGRANNLMMDEHFRHELKELERMIRPLVRKDHADYYDELVCQLQESGELNDFRQVYRILSRLGRKKKNALYPRPLPLLHDHEGNVIQSYAEQQKAWMKHFSDVEAGILLSWDSLKAMQSPGLGVSDLDLDLQCFPSAWDIQASIRKFKPDKAPGPNHIPPGVYKAGGEIMAKHVSILTTKVVAHAREPLNWKGGKLIPLHKAKHSSKTMDAYRSIFVSDYSAKLYHISLRKSLVQVWEDSLSTLQIGGRKGMGADLAHHVLQAHQAWARFKNIPAATLFIDLKAAFYTVIRQGLLDLDLEVSPLIYALVKLGIKPDEVHALLENAQAENATQGLSKHSAMLLQDLLTNTHFQIDQVNFPCLTTRGTRPGDPVADILFNLTMSLILKDVREEILQSCQVEWFGQAEHCQDFVQTPEMPPCGFAEVVFVDDVALLMHGPDNYVIEEIATKAVSATVAAAARRGLAVSFEKGKTELMWEVRGQGSRKCRTSLSESNWQVEVETVDGTKNLRVVHAYKHLGTWVQSGALVAKDISQRAAGARSAWGALHRPFYCKRAVADRTKLQVFQATSMSKHMYNAHTWSRITPADLNNWIQKVRPMLYSFARKFLHGQAPFKFSIEVLAGIIQFLSPLDQLHISRLRYLKRLTRYCPAVLWGVLCEVQSEPNSWIAHCRQSLQWFQKFHKHAPNLPVDAPMYQWMLAALADGSWAGKIKKAAWSCIQFRYSEAQYAVWLDHFEVQFVKAGGFIADRLSVQTEVWRCEICSEQFGSKRALAMHAHKKHQYRKIAKYFAIDGLCNACMKQFHCRSRLCNHLNGRRQCLDILQAVFPPLPEEVVEQLDQEDRNTASQLKQEGWRSTKAFEPALTLLGPRIPRPGDEGLADVRRRWDLRTGTPGRAFHNLQGYCASIHHANEAESHEVPKFVMQSPVANVMGQAYLVLVVWPEWQHVFTSIPLSLCTSSQDTGGSQTCTMSLSRELCKEDSNSL